MTLGCGTYIFITNENEVIQEDAGLGAFLIVLGLLFRNWRMTLFVKDEKNVSTQSDLQGKGVSLVVVIILSCSVFVLHRELNGLSLDVSNNESEIRDLDDKFEYKLNEVESFEERLDDLELYSHSHY